VVRIVPSPPYGGRSKNKKNKRSMFRRLKVQR
jgi:hypothetical protein